MYLVAAFRDENMHFKRTFSAIALSLASASCAGDPAHRTRSIAWDGLGRDPRLTVTEKYSPRSVEVDHANGSNNERKKVLATLRPYSEAWWAVNDEIEAENDRALTSKLAICKGCMVSEAT